MTRRVLLASMLLAAATAPAFAHVGVGATASFAAGFGHPLSGLDHMAAMIAVGLAAALRGGRATLLWPATFVVAMLVGGAMGMAGIAMPFVEQGILASVIVLGLMAALALELPVASGAALIGVFALFHGHAHGAEVPETSGGLEYMAGFALATALLHAIGIATVFGLRRWPLLSRAAGAACAAIGVGLTAGVL